MEAGKLRIGADITAQGSVGTDTVERRQYTLSPMTAALSCIFCGGVTHEPWKGVDTILRCPACDGPCFALVEGVDINMPAALGQGVVVAQALFTKEWEWVTYADH